MLTLRARLFIIISFVVLLILAISIVLLIRSKAKPPTSPLPAGAITPTSNIIDQSNFNQNQGIIAAPPTLAPPTSVGARKPSALEVEQNSAKQLAKIFVERFNTYSSDNNWQNIKEVETLVSVALWKKISAKIGAAPSGAFVGSTTVVLTNVLGTWNPPAATVTLQVRQTLESKGAQTVAYKIIIITLTKASGAWLVDNYQWQK